MRTKTEFVKSKKLYLDSYFVRFSRSTAIFQRQAVSWQQLKRRQVMGVVALKAARKPLRLPVPNAVGVASQAGPHPDHGRTGSAD